jgi:UDP-N-acetylglucosamine--N-acetylmuramyl-(pentapeptide) pyrophosphoryl-undecaprenol N-acetylglucosamine transferase
MEKKRIIITGGGTAGHIYPAVSIIEYIKDSYPETEMLFIGTRKGMEKDFIAELGIKFETVSASGLAVTSNFFKRIYIYIRFFFLLIAGAIRSIYIIRRFKPDFVLGTGGYVCGPVFFGARLLGRKIVIHEQNYIPGRLNRFFAKYSEFIFISFEGSQQLFNLKGRIKMPRFVFSGNPVRKEIRDIASHPPDYERFKLKKDRFTVIAFGGSLGAEKINNSVFGLYEHYRKNQNLQFILICGQRFYPELKERLSNCFKPSDKLVFSLFPFVKDIEGIYRIADLVISRAGATTVAELATTGIPSILVPYPEAIEDHQFYNASQLVEAKKSIIILDKYLNKDILINNIESLLANKREKYVNMKKAASGGIKMESQALIVEKMFALI